MKTDTSCVVNGSDLKSLLADAQIPALPTSAMRLLDLSKNPQCGIDEYALAIEADPSLSIQVLRFANSSYFGFAREISSVRHSLMLLGIRPIRNFVLWSAVYSLVPNPTFSGFDLKSLWQDSLRRAVFARTLGRATQLPTTEELFAAALLQDVSIPIFLKEIPEQYSQLLQVAFKTGERLSTVEHAYFGWDHAQASAQLCRNWHLPEEISSLIEQHTQIDRLLEGESPQKDACCVALSALLPSVKSTRWPEKQSFLDAFERLTSGRGLAVADQMSEADKSFAEFAPMLNLPLATTPLCEWLDQD